MEKIRLGQIGLGARGYFLLRDELLRMPDEVTLTAVCDIYPDRVKNAQTMIEEATGKKPFGTTDAAELIARDDVDAVLITAAWETHIPLAIAAMEAGKPIGLEVGGAYSVEDCWRLVRTYERTRTPFMFMENCCYGERETMLVNMIRQGVFGEVVACSGGYCHDLRDEVSDGWKNRHYRLDNYIARNAENYPTHELGPIAQMLDIHNGNRMVSLVSVASCARGLEEYVREQRADCPELQGLRFAQGDIVTTVIRCAGGQTITLELDTTLPRFYSRRLAVHGTKAYYNEDADALFIESREAGRDHFSWLGDNRGNAVALSEEYNAPLWQEFKKSRDHVGGHGGMDTLVLRDFFAHLRSGEPMPIDVYDAAAWMSITPLSEISIATGQTVAIPDFTGGRWHKKRK